MIHTYAFLSPLPPLYLMLFLNSFLSIPPPNLPFLFLYLLPLIRLSPSPFFALLELSILQAAPDIPKCYLLCFCKVCLFWSPSPSCPVPVLTLYSLSPPPPTPAPEIASKNLQLSQHIPRKCTFPIRPPLNFYHQHH